MRRCIALLCHRSSRPKHELSIHGCFFSVNKNVTGMASLDIYGCNLRISVVGKHGDIDQARALFDQMPRRDVITFASMIDFYLKNSDLAKAQALFRRIPERNVVVDSAMIDGFFKNGMVAEAQKLFDEMPVRNVFTWTSMVSGYCRIGRVEDARRIFDEMPEKNVVSWTTMLSGYARNGLLSEARELFDQMPERSVVAWTAMIKSYVDEGMLDEASELFDKMPHRNLYSWNIMLLGYLSCRQASKAISMFSSMPQRNAISWTTMVTGLAENDMIDNARELFDQMPRKDIAAWNAMVTSYINKNQMDIAHNLFEQMPERNAVSWNALIDGYVKNGLREEAFRVARLMLRSSVKPDKKTLTSLLSGAEGMTEVIQLHAFAVKLGCGFETSLSNCLVTSYSKSGDLGSSFLAFKELRAKDLVSWTSLILAFANHGCGHQALQAFALMLRNGAQPDAVTFIGVLSACSHTGLVDKGIKIFKSMKRSYELEPKSQHYCCLIDILGRAGRIGEAIHVLNKIPLSEKDSAVLSAMLGACKVHGEIQTARRMVEEIIDIDPNSSGTFVLLANAYATRGEWFEVSRVRKLMREMRVEKLPGFSQIDVKMRSHVFFSADRVHSQQEEVYEMLEEVLLPQMKDLGFIQEV
ncbi:Pentatricopeptide repeat-containing protein [Apostasia shenzhenica]|uniref:Pentatricopeptide repeat-containing protein n=1 Tax=Apostasia shenzhenica TaxID=1088818 RepID=A0A2I0AJU6_9ASPA|nr:Pentatricopeptide repeat-containing protein [Apostasia shenzhenica]